MPAYYDYKTRSIQSINRFKDRSTDKIDARVELNNTSSEEKSMTITLGDESITIHTNRFPTDVEKVDLAKDMVSEGVFKKLETAMDDPQGPSTYEQVIKWMAHEMLKLVDEPCDVNHITEKTEL